MAGDDAEAGSVGHGGRAGAKKAPILRSRLRLRRLTRRAAFETLRAFTGRAAAAPEPETEEVHDEYDDLCLPRFAPDAPRVSLPAFGTPHW